MGKTATDLQRFQEARGELHSAVRKIEDAAETVGYVDSFIQGLIHENNQLRSALRTALNELPPYHSVCLEMRRFLKDED